MQEMVVDLQKKIDGVSAAEGLKIIAEIFGSKATFSTSFGMEDQIITHFIATQKLEIPLFTLDTGRLFPETYAVWQKAIEKWKIKILAFYPDPDNLQKFISGKGPNSFYESVENRKECCFLRKVLPLKNALTNKQIWITGIRAAQSKERKMDTKIDWDAVNKIIKYHPVLDWTDQMVEDFIAANDIPVNTLHKKGFVSIGCAPCTRAITPGEESRAGRWWWEEASKKECGLHNRP